MPLFTIDDVGDPQWVPNTDTHRFEVNIGLDRPGHAIAPGFDLDLIGIKAAKQWVVTYLNTTLVAERGYKVVCADLLRGAEIPPAPDGWSEPDDE